MAKEVIRGKFKFTAEFEFEGWAETNTDALIGAKEMLSELRCQAGGSEGSYLRFNKVSKVRRVK